ncbi:MBL fold metallo-hydrolase [secondary endosymbiont of Ctenarytaina eucalypti]|uniref:Zn-dependent hydrolase, glyoxylase n=1 Tax=secondary endosymbiont of Ctenarytaina eucalypti TaxID=1199245 RepID=J3TX16_9ENTR|nr:MBL fold metallo-hydrolase [secondary endosymbiont of Ctenarytaina eucalypti]AFP84615.1 Zn-dependent hydrolase, glyoxylase [secondary endosymbiont of Ctenarytaina eucalypti]
MKYHIIPVTAFSQNCSLIWCKQTGEAALVDPGGEAERVRQEVAAQGVMVKKIWLTHAHLDHVGAARELALFYHVPILGPHRADAPLLTSLPAQCQMFGVKCIPSFMPDYWLKRGVTLTLGQLSFSVLHCPGHSPGHVVFWNKAAKFILMGDVLFHGMIGRTDLPGGDKATLIHSIQNKLMPLSDEIAFLPGHGPMSFLGHERRNNPCLQALST